MLAGGRIPKGTSSFSKQLGRSYQHENLKIEVLIDFYWGNFFKIESSLEKLVRNDL